jgi:hypothetical protein
VPAERFDAGRKEKRSMPVERLDAGGGKDQVPAELLDAGEERVGGWSSDPVGQSNTVKLVGQSIVLVELASVPRRLCLECRRRAVLL